MSVDYSKIHPDLLMKIGYVLQVMYDNHTPMKICDGFRTQQEQHDLYLQGRDPAKPGPIVTHVDGVTVKSAHQSGRAVDCCFTGDRPFGDFHPWGKYGEAVKRAGLAWGGSWNTPDRPHAELPLEDLKALKA